MIIAFGITGKRHPESSHIDFTCPRCGGERVILHIVHRFFHFCAIPIFPFSKVDLVECPDCHAAIGERWFPEELRNSLKERRKLARPPKYLFAGLSIAFFVVVGVLYSSWSDDNNTQAYLVSPKNGDMYIIDTHGEFDATYSNVILRITSIDADSVQVAIGTTGYLKSRNAESAISTGEINTRDYFIEGDKIKRGELPALLSKYKLQQIVRPGE